MNQLQILVYDSRRTLTTAQLAKSYETDVKVISMNFTRNKDHYKEGNYWWGVKTI